MMDGLSLQESMTLLSMAVFMSAMVYAIYTATRHKSDKNHHQKN